MNNAKNKIIVGNLHTPNTNNNTKWENIKQQIQERKIQYKFPQIYHMDINAKQDSKHYNDFKAWTKTNNIRTIESETITYKRGNQEGNNDIILTINLPND